MLFNSYTYFALFLPIAVVIYYILTSMKLRIMSKFWLFFCSLFFYSWWDIRFLPLMIFSILFNFTTGVILGRVSSHNRINPKLILIFGISINITLLAYFKYANFIIVNFNMIFSQNIEPLKLILPLAISFFTFQQITYLVDSYKGQTTEYNFLNYALFISFFPQLIAGPIVHHKEMMPQFESKINASVNYRNLSAGMYLFLIGLFKKVVIADSLSRYVSFGFDTAKILTLVDAWKTSLSFTFQIYFDFSGYMDMAMGSALLLNINLPINFDSPYKSLNIREFWRKWHITLGRFLKEHVYIPLGGNRTGDLATYRNILITFIIGGLWHGASWTFVFWGFIHGIAIVLNRIWERTGINLQRAVSWFLTFNFINFTWIFFRAREWKDAAKIAKGMIGLSGFAPPESILKKFEFLDLIGTRFAFAYAHEIFLLLLLLLFVTLFFKNTRIMKESFRASIGNYLFVLILGIVSFIYLDRVHEFLYFNF